MANFDRWGNPEMSDKELFRIMRKALAPKPRMILAKAIQMAKRKAAKPVTQALQPVSDDQLLGAISHACALGKITGFDALALHRAVEAGKPLPEQVRRILIS